MTANVIIGVTHGGTGGRNTKEAFSNLLGGLGNANQVITSLGSNAAPIMADPFPLMSFAVFEGTGGDPFPLSDGQVGYLEYAPAPKFLEFITNYPLPGEGSSSLPVLLTFAGISFKVSELGGQIHLALWTDNYIPEPPEPPTPIAPPADRYTSINIITSPEISFFQAPAFGGPLFMFQNPNATKFRVYVKNVGASSIDLTGYAGGIGGLLVNSFYPN